MPVMAREASITRGPDRGRVFPRHGSRRRRHRRLDVALGGGTARARVAHRRAARRGGLSRDACRRRSRRSMRAPAAFARSVADDGSVTILGAVSPPGNDLTEPVTAHTRRAVRCVWTLDRDLAYARHYPAVTWRDSSSRDADALARWHEQQRRSRLERARRSAVSLLAEADRRQVVADLVGVASLPAGERLTLWAARILRELVLRQSALNPNEVFCAPAKQAALLRLALDVHDTCRVLVRDGVEPAAIEALGFGDAIRARDESGARRRRRRRRGARRLAGSAWRACGDAARSRRVRVRSRRSAVRCSWSRASPASAGTRWPRSASGQGSGVTASCSTSIETSPSSRCSKAPSGMRLDDARVSFTGAPMQIAVGPAWLGRVCNGRGEPIDGGPPITGNGAARDRRTADQPGDPRRSARCDPDRRLGGRRPRLARTWSEAADLLGRRLAASRAGQPDRSAGERRRRAVRRRLRGHRRDPRRCECRAGRARGALGARRSRAAPQYRRRSRRSSAS